jgi:hypothetical protein
VLPTSTGGSRLAAVALLAFLVQVVPLGAPAFATSSDRIELTNGTTIIGEAKGLDGVELRVKTDYMRTVWVDWNQVLRMDSAKELEVELVDGVRHFGAVVPSGEDRVLMVMTGQGTVRVPFDQIVQFTQTRTTTRAGKIDISISAGFNFTQATDSTQFSFDGTLKRRTRRFASQWGFFALYSDTSDQTNRRTNLDYQILRHLPGRWTYETLATLQKNEQLGLDLRTLVRATAQHRTVRTSLRELWLGAGLALSNEHFTEPDIPRDNSVEGAFTLRYRAFHFDEPELEIHNLFVVYPSLTTSGRVRSELNLDVRRELVKDLFWSLALYWTYDNKPVGLEAEKEDLSIVGSLGWVW